MKLCYQVATPDVAIAESVTAYQGPLERSFTDLAKLGYDGVEFMTIDPGKLNWQEIRELARQTEMMVGVVCTGEVFGQLHVSFTHKDPAARRLAVEKVKELIDFASSLEAKINIGRVRGCYYPGEIAREQTEEWMVEALQEISDYAAPRQVAVALETVTILQINLVNTLAEAREVVKRVDRPNFGVMMDTFHLNIEEKDMFAAIEKYSPENMHVHLCDNNRRYPGNCAMDFRRIIQTFHDVGYDECFCTEIMQFPSMEEAARLSIEHLAPIFADIYGRPIHKR